MANGFERSARLLTGSQETIAKFRVQTSDYQAQYGRRPAAAETKLQNIAAEGLP